MGKFNFKEHPHRRFNPLTSEWVLVSPHRTKRPWQGQQEEANKEKRSEYDPNCYLCPDNTRANGITNPKFKSTYVFPNDFAAILNDTPEHIEEDDLFKYTSIKGECRVICFSPRHDLTLPEMSVSEIKNVVDVWKEQFIELSKKYKWVQIFENKGAVMGSSNPHPHGQIWANNALPNEASKELISQQNYFKKNNSKLLLDYANRELDNGERLIIENDDWISLVPFWAVWPYETMIIPKRDISTFKELTENEKLSLAELLKNHLTKYDNLFSTSFPYTMGWHNAPSGEGADECWQLHAHIYPPLLRSASVKKFMVGYEMLSEAQRDITAEQAADTLRSLSIMHYKNN
ncbi:MAG: UDP-glucose--hexose-1-phosphate uridylyltransferase [Melioribacteraceae bacterium]|nr:UDP-glucose--hexose-1-phosphate uridylyltransferase [Melioribacteraceae bacterium]